jgi:hypothetical protein
MGLLWIHSCTPAETDPVTIQIFKKIIITPNIQTFFNYDAAIYGNNFSSKTAIHLLQLSNFSHRFQKYGYGKERYLKIYGAEIPPLYPIGKISVPTLIVSSDKDNLITQQVILQLLTSVF